MKFNIVYTVSGCMKSSLFTCEAKNEKQAIKQFKKAFKLCSIAQYVIVPETQLEYYINR